MSLSVWKSTLSMAVCIDHSITIAPVPTIINAMKFFTFFLAASLSLSAADVAYVPKEKVAAAMTKPGVITSGPDHKVSMSRREGPGKAEVHLDETDVFYIVEGSATFVTGGKVLEGRTTRPGQILGTGIEGGDTQQLATGDVIVIPRGTPHWFKEVPELVVYYVVKAVTLNVPPAEEQISTAILAAPEDRRADATVLGYDPQGAMVTLRKGSGDMLCLGDNPRVTGINVACYHKDLEPFMARGRELSAQGFSGSARHEKRWKEVDDGKLEMPREPRLLYVLTGKGYDAAAGALRESYIRWVVYSAYATPESTGLTTEPSSAPWLMYPGKAGAHIMFSPPRPK